MAFFLLFMPWYLALVLLLSQTKLVTARYHWFCDITDRPVQKLVLVDGEYYEPATDITSVGDRMMLSAVQGRSGFLRHGADNDKDEFWFRPALSVSRLEQELQQDNDTATTPLEQHKKAPFVLARECCSIGGVGENVFYCPFPRTHCAIPWGSSNDPNMDIGCVDSKRMRDFTRSVWPVLLTYYGGLVICAFLTVPGRNSLHYLLSRCIPGWNEFLARRISRHNPRRATLMIRRFYSRHHRIMGRRLEQAGDEAARTANSEDQAVGELMPPTELVLKFKTYCSAGKTVVGADEKKSCMAKDGNGNEMEENDDELEEDACAICFGPFEDGDRVGALPCYHMFHVDCLKGWLARKNVCPLCLRSNVATPRFGKTRNNQSNEQQDEGATDSQMEAETTNSEPTISNEATETTAGVQHGGQSVTDAPAESPLASPEMDTTNQEETVFVLPET